MAFKPNYGMRNDRGRAAQARSEQKQKKSEEKSAHRQANREAASVGSLEDDKVGLRKDR
jgi:hypothetical protein